MKLADTLYRVPRQDGLHLLHQRGGGLMEELSSWRLVLAAGDAADFETADEEAVLVIRSGTGTLRVDDEEWPFHRAGVFLERASALCLPAGRRLEVEASADTEAILVASPVDEEEDDLEPAFVGPDDVVAVERGRDHYRHEVHDLVVDEPLTRRLLVGETFNPPGMWSSYPPHKHDGRDHEPRLEEVCHYAVDQPHGFCQQMLYTRDGETVTHTVRDGDAVVIPYGYHPVAAPPGYRVCLLWALAGDQRVSSVFEDPDHRWIDDAGGNG